MKYIIDEEVLYNGIDAEVSTAADMAYDKNGNPLFDGIILTEKDGPLVKSIIHDAGSRLVGRMADIAKFSADVEETTTNSGGRRFMAAPVLRANTEQIIINDPQWGAGKAALSATSILLTPAAQSVLVGYKNPKQGYKIFYSDDPWLTIADTEVDGKPYFRISVTENTTGAQRVGKFWLEYYARDYEGDLHQFLGISVNVIQVIDEGSIVTIQIPDDSDIKSNEEYYSAGYSYSPVPFVSTTKMAAIEYTGGTKFIPITFSDGTTFLQRLQAGDVTIVDEWATGPTAGPHWCWITPAEGGLMVECEESSQNSWLQTENTANPIEWPKYREHVIKISFANVLNASTVDYTINQRSIPLGVSGVDPYAIPFRIGHSTMLAFDAEGGEQSETISSTTGTFTLTQNNASEYPDWLTVSISADYKKITYTCTPNNTGEMRKFWASYTAHKVGSDETATFGTFIEQYYSNQHPDLGLSANPKEIAFSAVYDDSNIEKNQIVLTIPDGYRFGYRKEGDFFTVTHNGGWLIAKLTSTNNTGAVKKGTITVYLTDYHGNDVGAKPITIAVTQAKQSSSGGGNQPSGGTGESMMISGSPTKFSFGVNGGVREFTKFWYVGGSIYNIIYDTGASSWFRLSTADKYVNNDTSNDKSNYNPDGFYLECDKNTTGRRRVGWVELKIIGVLGGKFAIHIDVEQEWEEITPDPEDPDPEYPVPVITCASSITIPASGYDGVAEDSLVRVFFPITLTNADDYKILPIPSSSFITKVTKYADGISLACAENDGSQRSATFQIVAWNQYNSTEDEPKTVTVTQQGIEAQTPIVPDYYIRVNKPNIIIKAVSPQDEVVVIDTNCPSLSDYVHFGGEDYSGDDWCQPYTYGDDTYTLSFYPNTTVQNIRPRTASVIFSYHAGAEIEIEATTEIKQLVSPRIILENTSVDMSWIGGGVSIPVSIVGLQYKDLKVTSAGAAVAVTIDVAGRNLVVEVSRNNHDYALEHEIEIEGSNELGEKTTATLVINQGVMPVYTGDDTDPDEGGSGGGGGSSTSGSGKDAIEFDVPDFDLNELLGTAYNKEGLFKEISRYFILFTCMKIFQERYADLVPIYTERAQAAMDNINNIIRQRKRPKRR